MPPMPKTLRPIPSFLLLTAFAVAQAPPPLPAPPAAPAALTPPAAMATIGRTELLGHATLLSSDAFGGRLTASPGQVAAAKYIAGHFASLGLEPLGDPTGGGGRSWFQYYGVTRTHVAPGSKLQLGALTLTDGFAVLGGRTLEVATTGSLRFCGLGRLRGERADVGADERLDGAVAVVVVRSPRGTFDRPLDIEHKFGASMQAFQQIGATATALGKRGAAAVLFVQLQDRIGLSDVLNYVAVAPGKDQLVPRFPGADATMAGFGAAIGGGGALSIVLSENASERVLVELGTTKAAVAAFVAGERERPQAKADVPATVTLTVARDEQATACNVVALLRGSDPALAAEAVVYSAHMDHVGLRIDGDAFNGADDNASGTAGLLAIASAYATAKERPRRSVIFLSVSGEELGLWGSQYFADHPTWDASSLVANVNTDMIGRSGPESGPTEVTVTPSNRHVKFSTIVEDAARFADALGCTFTNGDKYYQRSDHYNFARKGIPVVFFCNGEHEDYHQVTDHADKLDGEKMERIARLAFWTGWSVANADERPRTLGKRERWFDPLPPAKPLPVK
jgi:hypothetical protein